MCIARAIWEVLISIIILVYNMLTRCFVLSFCWLVLCSPDSTGETTLDAMIMDG